MIPPWNVTCDNRPGSCGGYTYYKSRGHRPAVHDLRTIPQLSIREANVLAGNVRCSREEFDAAAAKQQEIVRLVKQSAMEASRDG